jgi:hypothetical protein
MLSVALLLACSDDPPPAPPTLDGVLTEVLRDYDTMDLTAATSTLSELVASEVLPVPEGVTLGAIEAADVQGLLYSDAVDWKQVYGGALARTLDGTLGAYAATVPLEDQAAVVGDGYARWTRTIVEGSAPGYVQGQPLAAEDQVEKQAPFGIVLPYPMRKQWTTVATPNGPAQIMRSVVYEAGWSDDGNNAVIAAFTVELWLPRPGGITWFNGTWMQVATPLGDLATPEFLVGEILDGMVETMDGTEATVMGG